MLDEQLLGGRRGSVGGGGAHEPAGGEGHGEGAEREAGKGQAEPGGARAALRPGGRRQVPAERFQRPAEGRGAFGLSPSLPLIL